jgi:hypothetical protein
MNTYKLHYTFKSGEFMFVLSRQDCKHYVGRHSIIVETEVEGATHEVYYKVDGKTYCETFDEYMSLGSEEVSYNGES